MASNGTCVDANYYITVIRGSNDITRLASVRIVFTLVYMSIFTFGIVGNAWAIVGVVSSKRLQSPRNILLVNLLLCDLILCFTSVPVVPVTAVMKRWLFGVHLCHLITFSQSVCVMVSSWTLTAIAIDRCLHINDPTRSPMRTITAVATIGCVWLASAVINMPYVFAMVLKQGRDFRGRGMMEGGICGEFCTEDWHGVNGQRLYGSTILAGQFLIPMVLLALCYGRIFMIIHRDLIVNNDMYRSSLSVTAQLQATVRRRRTIFILCSMVLTFVISWLPQALSNVLKDFDILPSTIRSHPYLTQLASHSIAMSTVISNPLLFYWLTMQSRRGASQHNTSHSVTCRGYRSVARDDSLSHDKFARNDLPHSMSNGCTNRHKSSCVETGLRRAGTCMLPETRLRHKHKSTSSLYARDTGGSSSVPSPSVVLPSVVHHRLTPSNHESTRSSLTTSLPPIKHTRPIRSTSSTPSSMRRQSLAAPEKSMARQTLYELAKMPKGKNRFRARVCTHDQTCSTTPRIHVSPAEQT